MAPCSMVNWDTLGARARRSSSRVSRLSASATAWRISRSIRSLMSKVPEGASAANSRARFSLRSTKISS